MKSRIFLAVSLVFFLFWTANAYTFSSEDQIQLDNAVSRIETAIAKKWESYRSRVIGQLQGYLPRAKNNERISAMLQELIGRIQKTSTQTTPVSTPATPNIVSNSKWYITPSTIEIDPILRPLTFGLIYAYKLEIIWLKESGDTGVYMKRVKELEIKFDTFAKEETDEFTKKLDIEFHTQLVELLDWKIDPNGSDYYAEIMARGLLKRSEKQLSLFRSSSEKQWFILMSIKKAQAAYDSAIKEPVKWKAFAKVWKLELEYLKKILESLNKDN